MFGADTDTGLLVGPSLLQAPQCRPRYMLVFIACRLTGWLFLFVSAVAVGMYDLKLDSSRLDVTRISCRLASTMESMPNKRLPFVRR